MEEERRRRLKEQEEKERAKDQAAAETAELEQRRQNELLRQKEQVRSTIHLCEFMRRRKNMLNYFCKLNFGNIFTLIILQILLSSKGK